MAPKKKPQSSVDLNRSKKPVSRTDAKGRTGMGASTASGKKPLPKDFGKRENELRTVLLSTVLGAKGGKKAVNESYTLGKTVVHASPQRGLKQINPQIGSRAMPTQKVAFGLNPKGSTPSQVVGTVRQYSQKAGTDGSFYVGKVPRGSLQKNLKMPDGKQLNTNFVAGPKPIKRLKEIPYSYEKFNSGSLTKDLNKALVKKGVVNPVNKVQNKIVSKKNKKQMRKTYKGDL
jgi:hypothetical protein